VQVAGALSGAAGRRAFASQGRAVQVDPMKPRLKPPGTERLKLRCDILLSTSAFKLNLRRYTQGRRARCSCAPLRGRVLHSSTFQLNLSRFCHSLHPRHPAYA
jgi:hypothetical protein